MTRVPLPPALLDQVVREFQAIQLQNGRQEADLVQDAPSIIAALLQTWVADRQEARKRRREAPRHGG